MSVFLGLLSSYALLFALGWVRTGFAILSEPPRSISKLFMGLLLIGPGLVASFGLLAVGVSKSETTIDSPELYYLSMAAGVCAILYFTRSQDAKED